MKAVRNPAPEAPAPALREDKTYELADMFKMLGDPSRLRIVIATLEGPVAVSDIAERLGLSISLVSHHLRLLARAILLSPTSLDATWSLMEPEQDRASLARMIAHVNERWNIDAAHASCLSSHPPLGEGQTAASGLGRGRAAKEQNPRPEIPFVNFDPPPGAGGKGRHKAPTWRASHDDEYSPAPMAISRKEWATRSA